VAGRAQGARFDYRVPVKDGSQFTLRARAAWAHETHPAAVEARAASAAFYDEMERTLGDRQWLAGSYSYADIAFYMAQLFGERWGAPMTDVHPRLKTWRQNMGARPAVRRVAGAMGRYLQSQGRKLPAFLAELT
jgi:glutathione S-transferase